MIFCAFLPFCIQKTSEQNFIKLFRNEDFYGCNITIWNFQKDPSGVLPYALCACTFLLWNVLPDQRQVRFIYQNNVYHLTPGNITFIPADTLHRTSYSDAALHECVSIEFTQSYLSELVAEFGTVWLQSHLFSKIFYLPEDCRSDINAMLSLILAEHQSSDIFFKLHVKNVFSDLGRAYFTIY